MKTWTTDDIPDLTGRVVVVTGGNGGLGFETSKALAAAHAHVIIAARNPDKAAAATALIRADVSDASVELVGLDLGDLASVEQAADTIIADHAVIDVLINNAGLMAMPKGTTVDGFETQFGVNHLGHWALTARLIGAILASDAGRVVTVSSTAHHIGRSVDPSNINLDRRYEPWLAYGRSKLANYHFAIGLQRQFEAAGVSAQSLLAHPGLANTDLQHHTVTEGGGGIFGRMSKVMASTIGMSAASGALSQLRAATDPTASGGQFYGPMFVNNGPPLNKPILRRVGLDQAIERLWTVSEEATGLALDVDTIRAAAAQR
jgi:NAD(P)-dependent dehydrogenase (short-subunit alcohol dehydrogenase family)